MIKTFASELEYAIPSEIRKYLVVALNGHSDSDIQVTYPVHANGFPLLIYVYGDQPTLHINGESECTRDRLYIAGQVYNVEASISIEGKFGLVGFLLYPTAPYYLFHKSGEYFLNKWQSFSDVCPVQCSSLMNSLSPHMDRLEQVGLLVNFLKLLAANSLPRVEWLDQSLKKIYKHNGLLSVESLADNCEVSVRHYRRKFKEVLGVPPKYFSKVVQLNSVFELIKSGKHENLHHLALDYGYFDQAHFISDFKKLMGESPNQFLMGKTSYLKTYMGKRGL